MKRPLQNFHYYIQSNENFGHGKFHLAKENNKK